jgi:RNA recognition motif-containing protein
LEVFVKIYVGNMSYTTTEDTLREAFGAHGDVEEVAIVTDRDTGRPRGFGFVTMPNSEEANAAIQALNNADLDGRTLKVNEARPRPAGGGGGGGPRRNRW